MQPCWRRLEGHILRRGDALHDAGHELRDVGCVACVQDRIMELEAQLTALVFVAKKLHKEKGCVRVKASREAFIADLETKLTSERVTQRWVDYLCNAYR